MQEVNAARDLLLDFMGNNYARLGERYTGARLDLARRDLRGFDQLMRRSGRGAALRDVAAGLWGANIAATDALAFQQDFAEAVASRPAHLSVMIGNGAGTAPAVLALTDPAGRRMGSSSCWTTPPLLRPSGGWRPMGRASWKSWSRMGV